MEKKKEFLNKVAQTYFKKGRYNPSSLQKAMNEEAMELTQENGYIQEFAAGIKEIRERLQKPRANEKATALQDAKKLQRNRIDNRLCRRIDYADKFKEDVKEIRKRIYGK